MKKKEWDEFQVPANRFCVEEQDKTKENWFLYELANGIFNLIHNDTRMKKKHKKQELIEFSIKLAHCAKEIIKNRVSVIQITPEVLQEKLAKDFQIVVDRKVIEYAAFIVNDQLSSCLDCSTRCIYDWRGECYMFDDGPY